MKKFHTQSLKALTFSASAIAMVMAGPLAAQEQPEEAEEQVEEEEEEVSVGTDASGSVAQEGRITVTGSRIRRDTYSSISPLQVLTTENQQAVGAFDPAQILQRSESAAGQQIDATFQGFVLDNGPGSQTLNLRGLGADRTLLLLNGRRLAPSGVEGAPTAPSINLIPATLVDRYDLLLDGASSVYGSDAVAGVGNLVLRKDFDGLELQANGNLNEQGAGNDYTVSAAWGFNTDRGFFGIGAEYAKRDLVRFNDRDFLDGCNTHYEIDQNGNILTVDRADNAFIQDRTPGVGVAEDACKVQGISGRVFIPFTNLGSVYFPANGNIANIPGLDFGESTNAFGVDLDTNGDGIRDVDFRNVNVNGSPEELARTLNSEQELFNVFAYGEYTFPGEANITPYFEANFSRAEINNPGAGNPQIFPTAPDLNEFNPCNFVTSTGVDCSAADNALQGGNFNPNVGLPLPVQSIAAIQGDRNNFSVVQETYRGVLGVRGDLPFIGSSWTFDVSGVYSRSVGTSITRGIREDRLALALGLDPTADFDGDGIADDSGDGIADDYDPNANVFGFFGNPIFIGTCNGAGLANPDLAAPDLNADQCVPVNIFADSVLTGPVGDFATQAERDYVFGERTFDTEIEQLVLNAFVTGDLFELPAGPVGFVLGGEYREDTIDSTPSVAASNGLFFAFFSDTGATGSRDILEAFAEVDVPLIAGEKLVEELNINLSGRITRDEFYGTNGTYSIKGGWRPVSPLLLKFSYGTSFRAPNLRELFLGRQSGFTGVFDPCAVPDNAFNSLAGGYDPGLDQRDAVILQNCLREGRDPTTTGIDAQGLNTIQTPSVENFSGGVITNGLELDPETSTSITTGFAFEETFASGFEMSFNFNYYDIGLRDSIIEPSSQFIVNDCFARDDGVRSQFCDRINFGGERGLVQSVFRGFLNLDAESVRGIDLNASFQKDVTIGGEVFDIGLFMRANHLIERSTTFTDDQGDTTTEDFAGEFGFPEWTGRATVFVDWRDFRLTWQTRYIGEVEQDADGIDPLADAFGNAPGGGDALNDLGAGPFFGDTCTGAGTANVAGDGVFCRDVGFAEEWFEHTVSLRWDNDTIRIIAGITNLFDTAPPLVDTNEVFGINNIPIGNGYNLDGREYFAQILYRF
ncbi:MAG: TonB-dependent receptor [Pseudomonadota bacterium]